MASIPTDNHTIGNNHPRPSHTAGDSDVAALPRDTSESMTTTRLSHSGTTAGGHDGNRNPNHTHVGHVPPGVRVDTEAAAAERTGGAAAETISVDFDKPRSGPVCVAANVGDSLKFYWVN